ncbi:MAG: RnfABCDGE type electron transport complex subunit D [Oscillospiraceae bacterium]|nr:RnfABCDGE type electron transport complex subunit D [Oscillospiraceae bacterium]
MSPKETKTNLSIMTDMLIVLIVIAAMSVYYYGMRAASVIAVTTVTCVVTDFICCRLRKKEYAKDISALITGLTLSMMLSASVPYYAAIIAAVFSIVVAKHAFGGYGCEIFNASAVGFLFTSLCFPQNMLTYPKAFSDIPMTSNVSSDLLSSSFTSTFLMTESTELSLIDALIGKFSGPMGTGFALLMLVAVVFLMLRRSVSAITFFTELILLGVYAFFKYDSNLMCVLYFFSSGMLLFGMIFLSCDYSIIPKTRSSRLIYGAVFAACVIIFNDYSSTENAAIYAVILSSPIGIELDRKALSFADMVSKRKGLLHKVNKPLNNITETLEILDNNEQEK